MLNVIHSVRKFVALSSTILKQSRPLITISNSTLVTHHERHPHKCSCCVSTSVRGLFQEAALGIEKLNRIQEKKGQIFSGPGKERYLERLRAYINEGNVQAIIKDDLINLIAIAENDEHLDLLEKVIGCTDAKNESLLDGWGATLMRLYYKMRKLERAYNNLKDVNQFGRFFNHKTCYKIVMTMLYDEGRYSDVIEVYNLAEELLDVDRVDQTNRSISDLVTVTFAALAKLNNKEALEIAKSMYHKLSRENARKPGLRPTSFLAYLAVNNDDPTFALNLISSIRGSNYASLRELKIISLIKLERYEDILILMRQFSSTVRRDSILLLKSTFDMIEQISSKLGDENLSQELIDILIELKNNGHVSEALLDELLFKPIQFEKPFSVAIKETNRYQSDRRREYGGEGGNRYSDYRYNNQNYNNPQQSRDNYKQKSYSDRQNRNNFQDLDRDPESGDAKKFTYQKMSFD